VSGTPTGTSAQITGVSSFSDHAVGHRKLSNFLVEAAAGGNIGTQTANTPFSIKITARDAGNNTVTSFVGTVDITSTCTLSGGSGTTAAFTAGVLASHSVTISSTGSCTITATRTSGSEAGTSNSFSVIAVSSFNAFETATPANDVTGKIFTKLVSTAFGLDVVAVSGGAKATGFSDNVKVELLANTGTAGSGYGADNCPTSNSVIQTIASTAIAGGRSTVSLSAIASAYRDVRVRISYPTSSPTVTTCSNDSFSVRPQSFTVTSTNANNTGTSGTPTIQTGANFNLFAVSVVGYDGTPSIDNTKVIGSPNAGAIGGSFGAAPSGTGTADGATFTYSEVGNFGLSANAVYDSSFAAAVDGASDCSADFSNTLVGGKYGCSFGSTTVAQTPGSSGFGRFIPDNFNVSYTATPEFTAGCGPFTYVGAPFFYGTAPQITVTARNGAALGNATTTNYAGSYMKLTSGSLTPATQALRYSRFDAGSTPALDTTLLPVVGGDPAIGTFTNGVGSLTFDTGTGGLTFTRSTTTPAAPFSADIALLLNVIDTDGVAFAGNPAKFGVAAANLGIAFSGSNNGMRYGRLRMPNALGSEKLDLPIGAEIQYWTGSGFSTNTLDSCTSLSVANFSFPAYAGGITAVNMNAANINPAVTVPFASGVSSLKLTKPLPTPATPGSTTLTVDLSAENKTYLKGNWGVTTYTANPRARAAFGVYGSQPRNFIFFRENY
jgi:MSHA biogenesis protein MshQ